MESAETLTLEPLKLEPFKKILNYYKPLMKPKTYTQQQLWLQQCYETQSFLPPLQVKQQKTNTPSVTVTSLTTENKQNGLFWPVTIGKWGQSIWKNAGKLITLALFGQVTVVQALEVNTTSKHFTSANNIPNLLSFLSARQLNQIVPLVNKPMLNLNITVTPTHSSTVENDPTETARNALNFKHYSNSTSLTTQIPDRPYNVDINKVLRQFNRVDAALLEAISIFNTDNMSIEQGAGGIRKARSPDILIRRPTCTVSKDKLDELKTIIINSLSNNDLKQSDINCNPDLEQSNNSDCENTLKIIQCGISNLREGFSKVMQINKFQIDDYEALKNNNDQLTAKLHTVVHDLKLESSQAIKSLTETYNTQIANIKSTLNGLLESTKGFTIKLCILEIHSGRITEAFNYFTELKEDSKLATIITDSYNHLSDREKNNSNNKLNNVENIMQFSLKFPSGNQATIVFQSLFNAMEHNNHLDSPNVLMLDHAVKKVIEVNYYLNEDNKNKLISINNKLSPHITNIITAWATQVRTNQEHSKIREFALKYDKDAYCFVSYLGQLIEKAYAKNLRNAETIINFIEGFGYIEQHIVGYSTLFEEMSNNHHLDSSEIIKLAYIIREFQERNSNMPNHLKNKFIIIEGKLPNAVRSLISNGLCHIKNTMGGEYLYAAADNIAYDRERRSVFTWRSGEQVTQGYWKFEPANDGSAFRIKNIQHQEYLYAAAANIAYDNERRRVFTWRSGAQVTQGNWKLEPINHATAFLIKNIEYQEYLYAAAARIAYDNERRRVFTWISRSIVTEGRWTLYCS